MAVFDRDRRNANAAAKRATGEKQVSRLLGDERDGRRRGYRRTAHEACVRVNARRYVECDDWRGIGVGGLDHRTRDAVDIARQADAEDCVDNYPGPI